MTGLVTKRTIPLRQQIEKYVDDLLKSQPQPKIYEEGKLIRDAIGGCWYFDKEDVSLLDSTFIQRLRRVHQNGLAYQTYPCARHTRFEHTLGVTILVDKMAKELWSHLKDKDKHLVDTETTRKLKFAAILHDCGHGSFSHVSEEIYNSYPEVQDEYKNPKFSKSQNKPHEIISYYIVTNKKFQDFLDMIADKNRFSRIDQDRIAELIIGNPDAKLDQYLCDMINGTFDADKLDYMQRDAYFTGLQMSVDVERILYGMRIESDESGRRVLAVHLSSIPNVEQILFNKMLLTSSMYHHHKVRALSCMLQAVFDIIKDDFRPNGGWSSLAVKGRNFKRVVDFLYITDDDILTTIDKEGYLKKYIEWINNRDLFKRALIISKRTVKGLERPYKKFVLGRSYKKLISTGEYPDKMRELRQKIANKVGCPVYEVLIDFPEPPSFREASQTLISLPGSHKWPFQTLSKTFNTDTWLTAYAELKWQGYVFSPIEIRKKVANASEEVFKDYCGIEFNPLAKELCLKRS